MKKRQIIELLIIIGLGFVPLLWFHGGQVILGHDSGLTLSPMSHFIDRLYAWTERFGFGNDQTYAIAGFFIHGLDALISSFGFNLQNVQKIAFIFWFLLPGLTMYYFSSRLAKKLNLSFFVLPVTLIYMFNHFLLQGWFVAERTKFSVYAALPLIMSFLFDWEEGKRSSFRTALFISLTLFFLNGEASLPLFGGLILSVLAFILFFLMRNFSKKKVYQVLRLFGATFLISFFLNIYWLLPYGGYLLQSYSSAVAKAGGLNGVLGWLSYVSQDSSLINIFRLQGIPEWYLNPAHPYASVFLNNPILIAISFAIPLAAFFPLYFIKEGEFRKKVLFFSFLSLLSMFFMAGSHPPFGTIYIFLINFLPGFVAFRNPFYKFAPALWFSYAILIGFTINYLLKKYNVGRKLLPHITYFLFCAVIILYSFPFLNGVFFDYIKGERSMRVNVPQYVYDFGKWSESKDRINTKVLALPGPNSENEIDAYSWGYWSLSPLTSLLTNAPIVNESSYMSDTEKALVEKLYKMIKNNTPGWQNFAQVLGIKSFLLRKDFQWNLKTSSTDNSSDFNTALSDPSVVLSKKFGDWYVYDLKDVDIPRVTISSKLGYLEGDAADLGKISSLPNFNPKENFYVSTTLAKNPDELLKARSDLYLSGFCISCSLEHKYINVEDYIPLITRDSLIYSLVEFRDRLAQNKLKSNAEKIRYYSYKSLKDVLALEKLFFEKKDREILKAQIVDYGNSLEKINTFFNSYTNSQSVDNNFLLELSDLLRIEKIVILRNDISDGEVVDLLNQKYNLLGKIKSNIDTKLWRTMDESNKKFLVSSGVDDQFEMFYRTNSSNLPSGNINFDMDGKNYDIKGDVLPTGWISLGKYTLTKGLHELNVKQPPENLYNGPSSVQLNSSQPCFTSRRIFGIKGDVYRISFQYRRIIGKKKFYARIVSSQNQTNPLDTSGNMLDSTVWDSNTIEYPPQADGIFYMTICSRPSPDIEDLDSILELKDMNIRKLTIPDVVFYKNNTSQDYLSANSNKKSQTNYLVSNRSNQDQFIVLNESYSRNWVLDGADKFIANGYGNGWIIKGKTSKYDIRYQLQDLIKLGFVVTGISLFISLILLKVKNE